MSVRPIEVALDRHAAIKAEMAEWLDGEVIAQKEIDQFGTTVAVVARKEDGAVYYDVVRGFWLGSGAGVSLDMRDGTVADLANFLLGKLRTGA